MARELNSKFKSYEFTEDELTVATIYTELQEKYLRTALCQLATERLLLTYDPANPDEFRMKHVFFHGKMEMLEELLALHESNVVTAQELYNQQANLQQDFPTEQEQD